MGAPRNPAHGVKPKSLYTAADLDGIEHLASMPGEVPFVRGPYVPTLPGEGKTAHHGATMRHANASFACRGTRDEGRTRSNDASKHEVTCSVWA